MERNWMAEPLVLYMPRKIERSLSKCDVSTHHPAAEDEAERGTTLETEATVAEGEAEAEVEAEVVTAEEEAERVQETTGIKSVTKESNQDSYEEKLINK